jgi:hypothetical protein
MSASMLDQALTRLEDAARHLRPDPDVLEKLKLSIGAQTGTGIGVQ